MIADGSKYIFIYKTVDRDKMQNAEAEQTMVNNDSWITNSIRECDIQ